MTILTCRDLTLSYDGRRVVEDLSFQVDQGDFLCIVGENGSGKSTLIKSILGLKQPEAGTLAFGENMDLRKVGYLPQSSSLQKDFPATAYEVALSGLINRRAHRFFYTAAEKNRTKEMLRAVDAGDLSGLCFRELSGGQRQRVLLARAMNAAEKLLILDEPVTGLDPVATRELYHWIACRNQQGMTVIMVTHDMEAALQYADHILHLGHEAAFFGTTEEYVASSVGAGFAGGGR